MGKLLWPVAFFDTLVKGQEISSEQVVVIVDEIYQNAGMNKALLGMDQNHKVMVLCEALRECRPDLDFNIRSREGSVYIMYEPEALEWGNKQVKQTNAYLERLRDRHASANRSELSDKQVAKLDSMNSTLTSITKHTRDQMEAYHRRIVMIAHPKKDTGTPRMSQLDSSSEVEELINLTG